MTERVTITEQSVPGLPAGVKLRFDRQRDQWVILAPERLFVLDAIALEIVKRCDGAASVAAIVDDLAATFKADRAVIERDVCALLQQLTEKGVMAI